MAGSQTVPLRKTCTHASGSILGRKRQHTGLQHQESVWKPFYGMNWLAAPSGALRALAGYGRLNCDAKMAVRSRDWETIESEQILLSRSEPRVSCYGDRHAPKYTITVDVDRA